MTDFNCFRLKGDLDGSSQLECRIATTANFFSEKNSEYVLFNNFWQPTPLWAPWTHPNCVSHIINGWVYGNPFLMSGWYLIQCVNRLDIEEVCQCWRGSLMCLTHCWFQKGGDNTSKGLSGYYVIICWGVLNVNFWVCGSYNIKKQ